METWTEEDARAAAADEWELRTVEGRYAVVANGSRWGFTSHLMGIMAATVGWKPFDPMTPLYRKALALHGQPVPAPKREPSALLKAAKEAATQLDYLQKYAPVNFAWSDRMWRAKDALNAAIACEEAKPATDEKLREAVRYYCTKGADGGNGYAALYAAAKDAGIIP